jgi:hemoglobin
MFRHVSRMLAAALFAVAAACSRGVAPGVPAPAPSPTGGPGFPGPVPAASPADALPPSSSGPSLYARLGGMDAIHAVVHDFTARVGADTRVSAFFRGVDLAHFEQELSDQICQAAGGPCTYRGRSMAEAHRGLGLTDAHFNAVVEDLVAALNRYGVGALEQHELLTALAAMKGDIVGH